MGRLRITGTYIHPRDPDAQGGETRGRTASEHGQGVIGLYHSHSGTTRITMHDGEDPATPLATAYLPWASGDYYSNQVRQSSYLGAGRAIVAMGPEHPYTSGDGTPLTLVAVTYREGVLSLGPSLTLPTESFERGAGYVSSMILYATSGSTFKMIAIVVDGYADRCVAADFAVSPGGSISRSSAWSDVSVVIDRDGRWDKEHVSFLVRGGSLFTFGDRIRRYDATTLQLQATSSFQAPADVADYGFGSRSGFGMPNFGPDGKIEIFEIEMLGSPSYPKYVKSVKVWHVDPVTLERVVVELDPPHSATLSATVPGFPSNVWNIMFPPVGPGYAHVLPLGDMRSSMGGLLIAYGRSKNAEGGLSDGGDSAAGLLHTGEWVAAETVLPPSDGVTGGPTNSPEGLFFTRDNYAVALDRRTFIGGAVVFFSTAPVLPPDTVAELGSYKQGYFS